MIYTENIIKKEAEIIITHFCVKHIKPNFDSIQTLRHLLFKSHMRSSTLYSKKNSSLQWL